MTLRTLLVLIGLSVCLAAPSCGPITPTPVPPTPPAYGGAVSTGGNAATGGLPAVAGAPAQTGGNSTGGVASQEQLACSNMLKLGCPEASN
jgi:hypothetical protein